jgi:hypothetical protein
MRNKYHGADQVHTASGSGMNIYHVGHSVMSTHVKDLVLKNVLHVPEAAKNLVSVHHFTTDNHASIEYFPHCFLIKDLDMRRTLLRGWCHNGIYPLPSKFVWTHAFGIVRPSLTRWHLRLGHPSSSIVCKVVSHNNLPCLSESNNESMCDACQKAKSCQLLIVFLLASLLPHWSLFSLICGVLLQNLWAPRNTMLVSSMSLVNLLAFIC